MKAPSKSGAGFTLVELLAAMVILAVLAGLAASVYTDASRRARRAEARAILMQDLQQQERYFTQNNTYVAFGINAASAPENLFKAYSGSSAAASAYEISGAACAGETLQTCLQLTATPGTANVKQGYADPHCGTLSVTTTGIKSASGSATDCW